MAVGPPERAHRRGLHRVPAPPRRRRRPSTSTTCSCSRCGCSASTPTRCERWRDRFRHVLVDEFQDTNARAVGARPPAHRGAPQRHGRRRPAISASSPGTLVTMGDGIVAARSKRSTPATKCSRATAAATSGPRRCSASTIERSSTGVIEITLAERPQLVSTPEHVHFAGYVARPNAAAPHDVPHVEGRRRLPGRHVAHVYERPTEGDVRARACAVTGERADAVWVHRYARFRCRGAAARGGAVAARYGLPTVPFVARPIRAGRGPASSATRRCSIASSRARHREGRARAARRRRTRASTTRITPRTGARARRRASPRRRLSIVLCGDRRGASPLHRISLFGYDDEGRAGARGASGSQRASGPCRVRWVAVRDVQRRHGDDRGDRRADRGGARRPRPLRGTPRRERRRRGPVANTLPFMPASSVRPGMVMVDQDGDFDVVADVEWVTIDEPGLRPRRRSHAQLRRQRHRHAQLDLQVPRGGLPQPDEVRGGVPGGDRSIVLDQNYRSTPAHPRRGERGDREQRVAPAEASLDRAGRGRADRPVPRRGRARRGRVRRARDPPAHRRAPIIATATSRSSTAPTRRAACSKESLVRVGRAVPRVRRREVLRPARDQGRARVPARAREPRRRSVVEAHRQHAASAASATRRSRRSTRTRSGAGITFRDRVARRPPTAGVNGKALGGLRDLLELMDEVEREAAKGGVARGARSGADASGYLAELEAERSIEAQGRIENLQELVGVDARLRRAGRARRLRRPGRDRRRRRRRRDAERATPTHPDGLARVQAFLEAISLVTDLDENDPEAELASR